MQFNIVIIKQKISHANLSEIIMKILTINGYFIVKYSAAVVSELQARLIAEIECISYEQALEIYLNTSVDIIVVSKSGAIHELRSLFYCEMNTNSQHRINCIQDLFDLTAWENDTFDRFKAQGKNIIHEKNIVRSLLEYSAQNSILFVIPNKVDDANKLLISFYPKCTYINEVCFAIYQKTNVEHLKSALKRLSYKILYIAEAKLINESIKINGNIDNCNELIFALKAGGAKEVKVMKALNPVLIENEDVSYLITSCIQIEKGEFLLHKFINDSFDGKTITGLNAKQLAIVLDYICNTTIGDELEKVVMSSSSAQFMLQESDTKEFNKLQATQGSILSKSLLQQDEIINDQLNCVFIVESKHLGLFEIRIPYSLETQKINKFIALSYFYSLINSKHLNICPAIYQYRLYPSIIFPKRIFECEEFMGSSFALEMIAAMKKYRNAETNLINVDRKSLISYIWGKKMAAAVNKLSSVTTNLELGDVTVETKMSKSGKLKNYSIKSEKKELKDIIAYYDSIIQNIRGLCSSSSNEWLRVSKTWDLIKASKDIETMYSKNELRLIPCNITDKCIRVYFKLKKKFSAGNTIRPNYEKTCNELLATNKLEETKSMRIENYEFKKKIGEGPDHPEVQSKGIAFTNFNITITNKNRAFGEVWYMINVKLRNNKQYAKQCCDYHDYNTFIDSVLRGYLDSYDEKEEGIMYCPAKIQYFLLGLEFISSLNPTQYMKSSNQFKANTNYVDNIIQLALSDLADFDVHKLESDNGKILIERDRYFRQTYQEKEFEPIIPSELAKINKALNDPSVSYEVKKLLTQYAKDYKESRVTKKYIPPLYIDKLITPAETNLEQLLKTTVNTLPKNAKQ